MVHFRTFTGTHAGTDQPMRISGVERWDLDRDRKVCAPGGCFDPEKWAQQTTQP
jgi:hypothetical protein